MDVAGASLTLSDIRRQPGAWRSSIERAEASRERLIGMMRDADEVIFMGAGCSYSVALFAQATFQQHLGRPFRAASSMDFFQFPKWVAGVPGRSLFITFSRSGETTETLESQRYARKLGAKIAAVTATEDAPIPAEAHEVIFLPDALEEALLPTVSTSSMMIAMSWIAVKQSEEEVKIGVMGRIDRLCERVLDAQIETGRAAAADESVRRAAFLGSGPMLAAAHAAATIWTMATGLPAGYHPLFEFRHGPAQACGPDLLLAAMITNAGRREDVQLVREMQSRGAKLLVNTTDTIQSLESAEQSDVLGDLVSDYLRAPLALPLFQSLAVHKAAALGRAPDDLPGQSPIVAIHLSQY